MEMESHKDEDEYFEEQTTRVEQEEDNPPCLKEEQMDLCKPWRLTLL